MTTTRFLIQRRPLPGAHSSRPPVYYMRYDELTPSDHLAADVIWRIDATERALTITEAIAIATSKKPPETFSVVKGATPQAKPKGGAS